MNRTILITRTMVVALMLLFFYFLSGCLVDEPEQVTPAVKFAADPEFTIDKSGLYALEEAYKFHFNEVYEMTVGLTHEALRAGDVDVAQGFATDGKIKELDLFILEDDLALFPAYHPAPVIREEVLEYYPEITEIMAKIAAELDTETMIYLNYLVDLKGRDPETVARHWLLNVGLISQIRPELFDEEPVIIGFQEFTEQQILGHITQIALKNAGIPVEDYPGLRNTAANRSALHEGFMHMYWEHTITAWENYYEGEKASPNFVEVYCEIAELDARDGLVWLDYAPLNNSYAIMMRKEHAAGLGINSISELAAWVRHVQNEELLKKE